MSRIDFLTSSRPPTSSHFTLGTYKSNPSLSIWLFKISLCPEKNSCIHIITWSRVLHITKLNKNTVYFTAACCPKLRGSKIIRNNHHCKKREILLPLMGLYYLWSTQCRSNSLFGSVQCLFQCFKEVFFP